MKKVGWGGWDESGEMRVFKRGGLETCLRNEEWKGKEDARGLCLAMPSGFWKKLELGCGGSCAWFLSHWRVWPGTAMGLLSLMIIPYSDLTRQAFQEGRPAMPLQLTYWGESSTQQTGRGAPLCYQPTFTFFFFCRLLCVIQKGGEFPWVFLSVRGCFYSSQVWKVGSIGLISQLKRLRLWQFSDSPKDSQLISSDLIPVHIASNPTPRCFLCCSESQSLKQFPLSPFSSSQVHACTWCHMAFTDPARWPLDPFS
jgi:hypothetical protein